MRGMMPSLCLLAACSCAPLPASAPTLAVPPEHWETNLVANPGFEVNADADGAPDGWALPPGQCAWDTAEPHAGTHSLRFTNTDKAVYRLVTAPVALIPGVRYRISAWVKGKDVRNGDEHADGAGLCIEWMDAGGNWLGGHYPSCKTGSFDWTLLEGETGPVPDNAAKGHVVLYLRKHNTGTAWFDDVEVRAIRGPVLAARLLRPAYRATLEAPTEGRRLVVEARVNRREHALPARGLCVLASLRDLSGPPLATLPAQRVPTGAEAVTLLWKLPSLPPRSYLLDVFLIDREGEQLGLTKATLHVVEPAKREVTIDERGRLLVEGKPFFPLGLYLGPTEDVHLERIAKAGFNTILCYGYGVGKEPQDYLDRAHRHGLKVIYSIKDFYEGSTWYPTREGMADLDLVRDYVTELRGHPALLAWYTNDELGPKWMPKLQAAYDLVRELDPDHPAFQVLCRPPEFRLYYGVTDILGCDPYPVPRHPVTMVGEWMDTAHRAMSGAKPAWCVPQIFQWANYSKNPQDREPTFEEKRAMVFLALIHRAQGLISYSYYDLLKGVDNAGFERRWKEVSSIAQEVKRLIPVLLDGQEIAVSHTNPVRCRVLKHGGLLYILAVNTSSEADAGLSIPLPDARTARRVDTGAEAQVANGKLTDQLKPLETAIYEAR